MMLVLDRKSGRIEHRHFYNLPDYLNKFDAIVLNDTKVFKARLIGKRAGFTGKIELLLLKEEKDGVFECLAKPAKRFTIGTELEFDNPECGNSSSKFTASVIDKKEGTFFVKFSNSNLYEGSIYQKNSPTPHLYSICNKIGYVPLPPYIKREPQPEDKIRYQTIYAKIPGAIAAPTAGLHFTDLVMDKIKNKGIKIIYITLHVGYGTFEQVNVDDIKKHKMHSEYCEISEEAADTINKVKRGKGKVLAVGTTVCRTIESTATLSPITYHLSPKCGYTDLFIFPGYRFKMTDMLLTNFHLPRTTLLMLTCAFGGYDNVMKAYKEAIGQRHRFYSYGDCMLIV